MKNWWKNNPDKKKEYNKRRNRIWDTVNRSRRLQFKDSRIYLKENPRKGICELCGFKGLTHMHHINYHDDNPLRDTIELCPSCHRKEKLNSMVKANTNKGFGSPV